MQGLGVLAVAKKKIKVGASFASPVFSRCNSGQIVPPVPYLGLCSCNPLYQLWPRVLKEESCDQST